MNPIGSISIRKTNWYIVWELTTNAVVASFFFFFVYIFANNFLTTLRISTLLMLIKESLDVAFYLCRKLPRNVSFSFFSWTAAFFGTMTPLLFRPVGNSDFFSGTVIQYAGLGLQILAILSLNRSFGIVPANRGIKKGGLYRFIRHPLYFAYTVTLLGFLINNFNLTNATLFIAGTMFQILRIFREEELLMSDEEYRSYSEQTKWKMVPYFF